MLNFLFGNGKGDEEDNDTQYTQDDDTIMETDVDTQENMNQTVMTGINIPSNEESNVGLPDKITPSTQATLVDLLVKAFPDSRIEAPKIVIVGSQSSGKTKLIISMIFLRLIHHPRFTDDMGNLLLQVFRTGTGLTTRRPITVKLLHTSDEEVCSINFTHQTESFDFGDPLLPNFITRLHDFNGEEIFESPLEITISAFQLPNIQFTDMPGLRAKDVPLADSPNRTLNGLVTEWIANRSNTVVAVESSLQFLAGGMETSLLHPILANVSLQDKGLRNRSILVLTRSDQVAPPAFNRFILPLLTNQPLAAVEVVNTLFQHIIAVVNKIEGQKEPHSVPFAEFRNIFDETKVQEREIFRNNGDLSVTRNCTTRALYNQIDDIFRSLLSQAFQSGYENMRNVEQNLRQRMLRELAPSPYLYNQGNPFSTQILLEELQQAAIDSAKRAVSDVRFFPSDGDAEFIGSEGVLLLTEIGLEWPAPFELGNIEMGLQRRQFFENVVLKMENFLDRVLTQIDQVFTDIMGGVFARNQSPFHHLNRFEVLQVVLQNKLIGLCDRHRAYFLSKLNDFMNFVWLYEEPTGQLTLNRLMNVMHEGRHILLVECIAFLHRYVEKEMDIDWSRDSILNESDEYRVNRRQLNLMYERALIQSQYLGLCVAELDRRDNGNGNQLETLIEESRSRLESLVEPTLFWEAGFWQEAYQQHQENIRLQRLHQRQSQSLQSSQAAQPSLSSQQQPPPAVAHRPVATESGQHKAPPLTARDAASYLAQPNILTSVMPPTTNDTYKDTTINLIQEPRHPSSSSSSSQHAAVLPRPVQFNSPMDTDDDSSSLFSSDSEDDDSQPENAPDRVARPDEQPSAKTTHEPTASVTKDFQHHHQESGTKRRLTDNEDDHVRDSAVVVKNEPGRYSGDHSPPNKKPRPAENDAQPTPSSTSIPPIQSSTADGPGSFFKSFLSTFASPRRTVTAVASTTSSSTGLSSPNARQQSQDTRMGNSGNSSHNTPAASHATPRNTGNTHIRNTPSQASGSSRHEPVNLLDDDE